MDPGERDARIVIERATENRDSYGKGTPTWAPYVEAWAKVIHGTGQERREAAQKQATVAATFRVPWSAKTAGVTPKDRIQYGGVWEIISAIPRGHRENIEITAVQTA